MTSTGKTLESATPGNSETPSTWGASWIAAQDYPALVALMDDMPPTYEAWLAGAVGRIEGAKARGFAVYPAPLDADRFVAWCAAKGLGHNAAGRQAFASDGANWNRDAPF